MIDDPSEFKSDLQSKITKMRNYKSKFLEQLANDYTKSDMGLEKEKHKVKIGETKEEKNMFGE